MRISSTYRFCTDANIFGKINPKAPSWFASNTIFKAMDGDSLSDKECEIWKQITGLDYQPGKVRKNILQLCGRRSGKTINSARMALREAFSNDHREHAAPGEKVFVLVVSLNLRSARVFLDYVKGFIGEAKILANEVVKETETEIWLKNGVVIASYPCSGVAGRGITIKYLGLDEASFMRQSGVTTDVEVFRSLRPCMSSLPNSRFNVSSSPYVKNGLVYDFYTRYYGVDNDFLTVVQAPSVVMNPTLDPRFLAEEEQADGEMYRREFLAQFVDSISSLFTVESIRDCVEAGVTELAPQPGVKHVAFFDGASGGPGGDSAALGIARKRPDGRIELVLCREWIPPFSPSTVIAECSQIIRSYGLSQVTTDRYSPGLTSEAFTRCGIKFTPSERSKSDLYREVIGPINSGQVRLLDNKKLLQQFASLERRVARGSGLETIDHPAVAGQHDDLSNVASGCLVVALEAGRHVMRQVEILGF